MSHKVTQEERLKFQLDRIALFSDAVFAIAITLLIIEIKVPVIGNEHETFSKEFWHSMAEMMPEFVGFFISFIVIGSFWRAHHAIFGFVTDYNRKLIGLNTWFLFSIVCMPFTTGIMSRYMNIEPYMIYCINIITSGLLQIWLWRYISNKKNHLTEELPAGVKSYKTISAVVMILCFLFSMILHKLLGGFIARIFLLSIFFIEVSVTRHFRKKYNLSKRI